jgi:protein-tyrosine phosphatase
MTAQQKEMLGTYDEARGRQIFTLKEFVGEEGDIGDPFDQGEERYRACRDEIKRCLEKGVDRLIVRLSAS